ncbi:MAG TPA: carbohydrate kinase family protein [Gammaproteobacteria bacterium]|nr:carbohydrate kinase family protein [Gammaproteobacteria bacterium]
MTALICGSFAYDTIMVFPERFRDHILPEKVHMLNVSFLVPKMRREFGGCAGNIAYNLGLLNGDGHPMGTVGADFAPYASWMDEGEISRRYVKETPGSYTAQAYIMTDLDDNQITAFHPGAMDNAHQQSVPRDAGISLGIVAPDGRDGMIQHAREFADAGIPFIFDPGQGLPMFSGDELLQFIDQATYMAVNDYESELTRDRTGLSLEEIADRVDALIVTKGSNGSVIHTRGGREYDIPCARAREVADPTGCGDAYRAGLIFGLMNDMDWETAGRVASLMGTLKVEHHGTQNHRFDLYDFRDMFKQAFGYELGV